MVNSDFYIQLIDDAYKTLSTEEFETLNKLLDKVYPFELEVEVKPEKYVDDVLTDLANS